MSVGVPASSVSASERAGLWMSTSGRAGRQWRLVWAVASSAGRVRGDRDRWLTGRCEAAAVVWRRLRRHADRSRVCPGRRNGRARVTPSDACGLGRASAAATPAPPSGRKRPLLTAKRLRWSRRREVLRGQNFRTTAASRGFRARLARPEQTAPEGEDAGTGPATPRAQERSDHGN